ncbi:MAG: enoyl-CoA hydratase/isomerase family protein, partial [Chloroflexi bacterium]|nr:enoyl-CoA hydratase/isomerase family protein [Chloroflexota bacterium]
QGTDSWRQQFLYHTQVPFYNISQIRKPTIAMINGAAVGMGMDITLHCDLRVGCENTRFFTYQNVGQIIENGGSYWLPHIAGLGRALELLFTGGFLMAEQAYEWGVLNRLVTADKLEEETRALCDKIIKSPPLVQWVGKRILRRALSSNLEATLELCAHSSGILGGSEDAREASRAFAEKRPPAFKGQ